MLTVNNVSQVHSSGRHYINVLTGYHTLLLPLYLPTLHAQHYLRHPTSTPQQPSQVITHASSQPPIPVPHSRHSRKLRTVMGDVCEIHPCARLRANPLSWA